MTSDPIRAAVAQLRADLDALPKDLAADPSEGIDGRWRPVGIHRCTVGVRIHDGGSSFLSVAECSDDYGEYESRAIAAHIARTASPHVTDKQVALLTSIALLQQSIDDGGIDSGRCPVAELVRVLFDAAELAEAITNRSTP